MKVNAIQSLKFLRLKRRLRLRQWQVVGVLESLWIMTQKNAPAGDIGRFSNEEIAAGMEWDEDSDELVTALIEAGFLDPSEEYRLVVHDWHEHAPNHVKGNMERHGKEFASSAHRAATATPEHCPRAVARHAPKEVPMEPPGQPRMDTPTKPSLTKPNQTKPYLTIPNHTNSRASTSDVNAHDVDADALLEMAPEDRVEVLSVCNRILRDVPLSTKPEQNQRDRSLTFKAVMLSRTVLTEDWLWDSVEAVKAHKAALKGPAQKYWFGVMQSKCGELGVNFKRLLKRVVVPQDILDGTRAKEPTT